MIPSGIKTASQPSPPPPASPRSCPDDTNEVGGGERLGREASGRTFDFDFDGHMDLIVGVHHMTYRSPGQTRLYRGRGDGTFEPNYTIIGSDSSASSTFAIPSPLCDRFDF